MNKGSLEDATATVMGENPSCGDEVTVQLRVGEDKIEDIKFSGQGCAICMASASMMTRAVKGKPTAEVGELFHKVHDGVQGSGEMPKGELGALGGVKEFPQRVKCALLAWEALREALGIKKGEKGRVTTETEEDGGSS
jgi:nitrogen fixation NifU-like protein